MPVRVNPTLEGDEVEHLLERVEALLGALLEPGVYEGQIGALGGEGAGVERVVVAREIDPVSAEALAEARKAGVRVLGRRCRVERQRVVLDEAIPAG